MNRLLDRRGLVFALVFVWKIALLLLSVQPVPANDSFFYDGPVVYLLNQGGYFNPSIVLARPISGGEVFSAYPPLYQLVLLVWMSVFGTSAPSAMWFHAVLFGCYLLVVLGILRQLAVPARCVNLAGMFLFAITFHDRPDSLAFLLGTLAIYAWVRLQKQVPESRETLSGRHWSWLCAGFVVLTLCTSLQIGSVYFAWVCVAAAAARKVLRKPIPSLPATMLVLVPLGLLALVYFGFPRLWAGFIENVHNNPSLTGLRRPAVTDLLKIVRNVPAILGMAGLLLLNLRRGRSWLEMAWWGEREILLGSGLLVALLVAVGCASVVTPNWVSVAIYLQPLLVGLFLASLQYLSRSRFPSMSTVFVAALLAGLAAIRAVGMTTWGLACAADVSYASAIGRVRAELKTVPTGAKVVLSSAYLYEAARYTKGFWIHEDYPTAPKSGESFADSLRRLRVRELILTQFDYYRRYESVLEELRTGGTPATITTFNTARVRSPDSYPRLRQVLQHISWAPVIVKLDWK